MEYTVKRSHQGDKWYDEGDTREANPADVGHLVQKGVLVAQKAAPPLRNKKAPKHQNKKA